MTIFYLLGYVPIAGLLLAGIWKKDIVGPAAEFAVAHDERRIGRIRIWAALAGATLAVVTTADRAIFLGYLPAAPFLCVALFRGWAETVDEAIIEMQERAMGALMLLNGLNLLDAILSDAAIGARTARELNPLVMAIGGPAKLALVAVLSGLLFWKRPKALVYPALVFITLIAYHAAGLLGGLGLAS